MTNFQEYQKELEAIAYEPIRCVEHQGICYCLGTELAVLRLAVHFKSYKVGCSAYFNREYGISWWFQHG